MSTSSISPTAGARTTVNVGATAHRSTPQPARPFKSVLQTGGSAVLAGAEAAVQSLPGGPVLSAAMRTPATPPGLSPPGQLSPTAERAQFAGGSTMEASLAAHSATTMEYLELQQRMQAESQHFTTLSNVMKSRHDTAKNAIGNIR